MIDIFLFYFLDLSNISSEVTAIKNSITNIEAKFELIEKKISQILVLSKELSVSFDSVKSTPSRVDLKTFDFPFETVEQVDEFEEKLYDPQYKENLFLFILVGTVKIYLKTKKRIRYLLK